MDQEFLDRLKSIEKLPTLPLIINQLQKLINNPRSNMDQIAAVISKDQAIAARVIRLVNSAFYGLRSRVHSIRQAIVVLGLNTVRNLTLGVSIIKTFDDKRLDVIFDRQKFWLHSFECAQIAKAIAIHQGQEEPEDFFLAGLLHDIGILVLDQFFREEFTKVLEYLQDFKMPLCDAENEVFHTTHALVGGYLGRVWKIPGFLIEVLNHHHNNLHKEVDSHIKDLNKVAVIQTADIISREKGHGRFIESWDQNVSQTSLKIIGLSKEEVGDIFAGAQTETKNLIYEWGLKI